MELFIDTPDSKECMKARCFQLHQKHNLTYWYKHNKALTTEKLSPKFIFKFVLPGIWLNVAFSAFVVCNFWFTVNRLLFAS